MSKKSFIVSLAITFIVLSFAVVPATGADTHEVAAEATAADVTPEAPPADAGTATSQSEPEVTPELEALLAELAGPEPAPRFGCPPEGGCDTDLDCFKRDYYCPSGSPKACFESSGTGSCDGWCGCCP